MLHQGDLLEKLSEKNLANVSFLKLLSKENLLECFTLQFNQKQRRIFTGRNFVEKSTCKQRGFFDHQNYIE